MKTAGDQNGLLKKRRGHVPCVPPPNYVRGPSVLGHPFLLSHEQLDFQLLYFLVEPVSIKIHEYFLDKLKSVFQLVWETEIQSIDQPKQHDESHCSTFWRTFTPSMTTLMSSGSSN